MDERARKCPVCGKPMQPRYRPFCGQRCADVDLGRWFGEAYSVPAAAPETDPPPAEDEDG